MRRGARHRVSSTSSPISTKGRSTTSAPSCLSTALRLATPFFSRMRASSVLVRQPEHSTSTKAGTKATSTSRFPNWPHTAKKRGQFDGTKLSPSSSSSSLQPLLQLSVTSLRRNLLQSLCARMSVAITSSSTTRVTSQKASKKRSATTMPNDHQAVAHQPASPHVFSPSLRKRCTVCRPEHSGMSRTTKQMASPTPSPNCAAERDSKSPRLRVILDTASGMNGQRHGMHSAPMSSSVQIKSSDRRISSTKQRQRKTTKVASADSAILPLQRSFSAAALQRAFSVRVVGV
mmetsp:Transcript_26601/g.67506  ORF Transcript_26601/g.67506 Transcript_26601/m.67506 type:complete len:289 (+) Transcript_26601:3862-4728(+)